MKPIRVYWLTCISMMVALAASATTIVMPTDEQLIDKTPLIVEGTVVRSAAVDRGNAIWTETLVSVDRALKGNAPSEVTIRELGGELDGRITKIFGAPEYRSGEQVLLFLTPTPRGDYQTMDLFVGKFAKARTLGGDALWTRDDEGADAALLDGQFHEIAPRNVQRRAEAFEQFVADRVAGRSGAKSYGLANPVLQRESATNSTSGGRAIGSEFTVISEPQIYRWSTFDSGGSASWVSFGTQPGYTGGGVNEISTAMNAWNSYTSAKIRYSYSGTESTHGTMNSPNGKNEVFFNDPSGDIAGTFTGSGVVGLGGFNGVSGGGSWAAPFTADSTHTQKTYNATNITEANLVIQDNVSPSTGISSAVLAEIVAHEFGHTLGFGHSTDSTALMYPTVSGRGASLRADDQTAARWLYPSGTGTPPPPPPQVPAAPTNLSATPAGTSVNLSWTDNAGGNATGESIYYALGSGSFSKAADLAAGTNHVTLSGFANGTYRLYVVAFNSAGQSGQSNTAQVTIGTSVQAPVAAFSVTPASGYAGQTSFGFVDQSTGSVTTRSWNFGDGATSSLASPSHVYANVGQYTVVLTVSNSAGQSQASRAVSVVAPIPATPPVAAAFDFSPPSPAVGQTVTFTDRSTGSPASWSWNFGDGATTSGPSPAHAFAAPGSYTVTLTASNSGSSSSATRVVSVVSQITPFRSLISVSAQTSGVGGSMWRTEVTLFNAGAEAANVHLNFIPGAGGSPLGRDIYLAPRQSLTSANALYDYFGLPSGAGAIAVEATSATSSPTIKISSRTFTDGPGGTYGQAVPQVSATDLESITYVTGMESDTNFRTNVGLVNKSGAPVATQLDLADGDGNLLGTAKITVPANNFQQGALASYFPAISGKQYASLSMRVISGVTGAISAYASVVDNRTQDPVYVQAMARPAIAGTAIIPAIGRAAGANGTFWRSDVTLYNTSGSSMDVRLRFLAAGADNRFAAERVATIAPGRTVVLADVMTWLGAGSGSGALQLQWSGSTGPVIASRTYTTAGNGGTYGQSIDAVSSFGRDVYVPGLRSDGSFRSNVGFVNSGDTAIGITATLLTAPGSPIANAFVTLPPKSQVQYSLASLFPGLNPSSLGAVTLQAHTDTAPTLFAYGSIVDNGSGDPVFFGGE